MELILIFGDRRYGGRYTITYIGSYTLDDIIQTLDRWGIATRQIRAVRVRENRYER